MQKTDRCTKTLLVLLVLGVWGLLLRPFIPITPAEAQSGARRTKWKYKFPMGIKIEEDWNALGKEGWELAGVYTDPLRPYPYGVFKRPIR